MRLFLTTLTLHILLLGTILHAQTTQKKDAIPTGAALKEAAALVNDVYKNDVASAKTPEQKVAFARKLLDGAKDEKGAGRYALLLKAKDVAVDAGDVAGCDLALDGIEASFDVDRLNLKSEAYVAIARNVRTPEDRQKLGKNISTTVQAALTADRFDIARAMSEFGLTNARSGNDGGIIKLAAGDMLAVRESEVAFAEAKKALLVLAEKPNDPDANLKVGKYRCFIKGDWNIGLPMLAIGSDATLKALAEKEIAGVTTADEQVKLGDAWWDYAEKLTGLAKARVQEHAVKWYRESLPSLGKGLVKSKIEMRLEEWATRTRNANTAGATGSANPIPIEQFPKEFVGKWKSNITIQLNADGTAICDNNTGKWLFNSKDNVIELRWDKDGWTDLLTPVNLKEKRWVKKAYHNGAFYSEEKLTPP